MSLIECPICNNGRMCECAGDTAWLTIGDKEETAVCVECGLRVFDPVLSDKLCKGTGRVQAIDAVIWLGMYQLDKSTRTAMRVGNVIRALTLLANNFRVDKEHIAKLLIEGEQLETGFTVFGMGSSPMWREPRWEYLNPLGLGETDDDDEY